jgi:hypothetical protein
MTKKPRWTQRPEGSTWGDWGADDQLGRLNLLGPEKVRQGLAEAREGLNFCLSLPLDYPGGNVLNPRRHPPVLRPTVRTGKTNWLYEVGSDDPGKVDVINDDAAILHLQYSTHWDSLAHVGAMFDADGDGVPEPVFYNGWRGGEHLVGPSDPAGAGMTGLVPYEQTSYAYRLGVENMAAHRMQGRAVMIDLEAHFGRERKGVRYDDLMRVMDKDKVEVTPGDMVCLRTGFADVVLEMGKQVDGDKLANACAGLDGTDDRLLRWITDSGLVALIADNYAVEQHPYGRKLECSAALPLHNHCLFKIGVNLGELWHLKPVADWLRQNGRNRFMLTAPPLRLPGAVGSPTTPIATV